MTITFFANFMNHHQLPLSLELIKLLGDGNYHFVAFEQIHAERSKMGYEDMNAKYPFIIRAYASDEEWQKALDLCRTSDITIIGNAPINLGIYDIIATSSHIYTVNDCSRMVHGIDFTHQRH